MNPVKNLLRRLHPYKPYKLEHLEDGTFRFRFWPTWVGCSQWGYGNTAEEAVEDSIIRARASLNFSIEVNRARIKNYEKHLDDFNARIGDGV